MKNKMRGLLVAMGTMAAGLAQAGTTYTYTYDYSFTVNGCSGSWNSSCGMTGNQTGSSVTPSPAPVDPNAPAASISATATGWANTQGNSSTYANQTLEAGQLQSWSGGLGVRNLDYSSSANGGESRLDANEGSSPEHATDNDERWDSIVYSFNDAITLTSIALSWYSNDSDLTILAYTGADAGDAGFNIASKLAGLTYSQLTSNGWSFIQNTNYTGSSRYNQAITTSVSSSYWLVGAFNSTFGSGDSSMDYVKIAALSGTITNQHTPPGTPPGASVPEPGSLLLLGVGGLLMARTRMTKRA